IRQPRYDVADPHLLVDVLADLEPPGVGKDHVPAFEPAGVHAEANVADPRAEAEQDVRLLYDVAHFAARHAALVDTDGLRVVLGDHRLAEERSGDGDGARLDE